MPGIDGATLAAEQTSRPRAPPMATIDRGSLADVRGAPRLTFVLDSRRLEVTLARHEYAYLTR